MKVTKKLLALSSILWTIVNPFKNSIHHFRYNYFPLVIRVAIEQQPFYVRLMLLLNLGHCLKAVHFAYLSFQTSDWILTVHNDQLYCIIPRHNVNLLGTWVLLAIMYSNQVLVCSPNLNLLNQIKGVINGKSRQIEQFFLQSGKYRLEPGEISRKVRKAFRLVFCMMDSFTLVNGKWTLHRFHY